jgi:hypothetical protein
MASGEEDVVLAFLARFATMSEAERDAALDALSPLDREALIALEQARTSTAGADILGVLGTGWMGLEKLREVEQPIDLLAVIDLAAREHPELVVEALFAAVVLDRGDENGEISPMAALREQWRAQVREPEL